MAEESTHAFRKVAKFAPSLYVFFLGHSSFVGLKKKRRRRSEYH